MRHYSQTGCLQKATPVPNQFGTCLAAHRLTVTPTSNQSGTRLAVHRIRHPTRALSSAPTPASNGLPVAIETQQPHSLPSPPPALESDMEDVLPDRSVRLPRVWVEEVADAGDFPVHKRVSEPHPTAGRPLPGLFKTPWEVQLEKEKSNKDAPWGEFKTKDDWDFARFLMKSGLSQERIDELLQLEVVSIFSSACLRVT